MQASINTLNLLYDDERIREAEDDHAWARAQINADKLGKKMVQTEERIYEKVFGRND